MYRSIDKSEYRVLHPRPVYLIVSRSKDGKLNVMAASWVSPISDEPFLVLLSIWKGSLTYQYIKETGDFTINIPMVEHVELVYKAGSVSGREVDKFTLLGLRVVKSNVVETPGLDNMLGFLECRVVNETEYDETAVFIARVEAIHVREDTYTRYGWDLNKAKILLHLGGRGFATPSKLITVKRE